MRREERGNRMLKEENKKLWYILGTVVALAVITFVVTYIIYGNRLDKISESSGLELAYNNKITEGTSQITSTTIGKSIEEVENTIEENTEKVAVNTSAIEEKVDTKETTEETNQEPKNTVTEEITNTEKVQKTEEEEPAPMQFVKPVEGEIVKAFAKDRLVYSDTLKEWITHNGIDIKAEKTTVVKAAESGTVTAIKNDPRYGITIVIEHADGFQTIYANLLTAEFVTQGETIEKGQTIGTVGNTATFEIADDPHLHFEILQNGSYVDPELWLTE